MKDFRHQYKQEERQLTQAGAILFLLWLVIFLLSAQHRPNPKRRYTIERLNPKNITEQWRKETISEKFAVEVIASYLPRIYRIGEKVSDNQVKFYHPHQDAWYLVTWEELDAHS